jgi:hypothetical protein
MRRLALAVETSTRRKSLIKFFHPVKLFHAMRCHSGELWYSGPDAINNAIDYAKFYSQSHHAVIRV